MYICYVYVHPNAANKSSPTYFDELKNFLNAHIDSCNASNDQRTKICVMGDFNCDFNTSPVWLERFEKELNMFPTMQSTMTYFRWSNAEERKLKAKQLDWTFATRDTQSVAIKTLPYECWFSDHVALFNTLTFDEQPKTELFQCS